MKRYSLEWTTDDGYDYGRKMMENPEGIWVRHSEIDAANRTIEKLRDAVRESDARAEAAEDEAWRYRNLK